MHPLYTVNIRKQKIQHFSSVCCSLVGPKHNCELDNNLLTVEPRVVNPHCFDADPDPAQNLDADPDPDPGGGGGRG